MDINDVACEKFFKEVWVKTAAINTSAYDKVSKIFLLSPFYINYLLFKVFRCVPADTIRHSSSISTYTSNRLVDEDIDESRKELQNVILSFFVKLFFKFHFFRFVET